MADNVSQAPQNFNDIANLNSFHRNLTFAQSNNFLKSFNSVLCAHWHDITVNFFSALAVLKFHFLHLQSIFLFSPNTQRWCAFIKAVFFRTFE